MSLQTLLTKYVFPHNIFGRHVENGGRTFRLAGEGFGLLRWATPTADSAATAASICW